MNTNMVDFNWYRATGTEEDWRIRAERLRAEIDANKYWYRVITHAVPRYASHEDADRVCCFLNRRMRATRVMERELAWLEQSITPQNESVEIIATESDARAAEEMAREMRASRKWQRTGAIAAACLVAHLVFRDALSESTLGAIILVVTFIKLCYIGVEAFAGARDWVGRLFYDARRMREIRRISERELINWHRNLRLEEHMTSGRP